MKPHGLVSTIAGALGLAWGISLHSEPYRFITISGVARQALWADGTNTDAHFNFPSGITVDGSGNLYVSDTSNHAIRQLTPQGTNWIVTTIAGLGGTSGFADGANSDARFNRPNGIVADPNGNLFVVDHYNQTIRKITPSDTNWVVTTIAGSLNARGHNDGTNGDAQFYSPSGIAIDQQGNLYVADSMNFTIRKIAPLGTNWVVSTIAGLALNYGFADGLNEQAQFDAPYDIAADGDGNLYVTDYYVNNVIRKITPVAGDWSVTTIAGLANEMGSADGTNDEARFHWPLGITRDRLGALYVTDQYNDLIRKITPVGPNWVTSTLAGMLTNRTSVDGVGSEAGFNEPWGITVDATGTLFVADWANSTIRMGAPVAEPAPALQISLSANQVVLTWPASATNFVLETSSELSNGNAWLPLTNSLILSGTNFVLTNTLAGPAAFYRLHKQ